MLCYQHESARLQIIGNRDETDIHFLFFWPISSPAPVGGASVRGRYSHVTAVMDGRVLLVAGGYSGVARSDIVAYKVPLFVSSDPGDRVHTVDCILISFSICVHLYWDMLIYLHVCGFAFLSIRTRFALKLQMKACASRTQSAVGVRAVAGSTSPPIR